MLPKMLKYLFYLSDQGDRLESSLFGRYKKVFYTLPSSLSLPVTCVVYIFLPPSFSLSVRLSVSLLYIQRAFLHTEPGNKRGVFPSVQRPPCLFSLDWDVYNLLC